MTPTTVSVQTSTQTIRTRTESDFLGNVSVPKNAYYGSFTSRAARNFKISGHTVDLRLIRAVAMIKRSAAKTNILLGAFERKIGEAIIRATDEILAGKLDNEFILDWFQAGAGTPLHMNVNEVIANRAEEILGGKLGQYKFVHPNNHVNLSQSSNDIVPTAIRIACALSSAGIFTNVDNLIALFHSKARKYKNSIKTGRTHLQDAVPMFWGQTFSAWAEALENDKESIARGLVVIKRLGIGGTAIGTGITAHPDFRFQLVKILNEEHRSNFTNTKDTIESTQNMNDFLRYSGGLRELAVTLHRICSDIRLLVSGPKTGIAELYIPEVEPGSSIMPGKVNPSVTEAMSMVCYKVIANDHAVCLSAQSSQLELNVFTPLIAQCLLENTTLLENGMQMLETDCIAGLEVNEKKSQEHFDNSLCCATALNPYLGYSIVAKLVREALAKNTSLKKLVVSKGILSEIDFEKIIATATESAIVNEEIKKRVKKIE